MNITEAFKEAEKTRNLIQHSSMSDSEYVYVGRTGILHIHNKTKDSREPFVLEEKYLDDGWSVYQEIKEPEDFYLWAYEYKEGRWLLSQDYKTESEAESHRIKWNYKAKKRKEKL